VGRLIKTMFETYLQQPAGTTPPAQTP